MDPNPAIPPDLTFDILGSIVLEDFLKAHDGFSLTRLCVLLAALAVRRLTWSRRSRPLHEAT